MSKQSQSIKKGIKLALLTSFISGLAIFYAKVAVAKIDPLILTSSRNLFVGAFFLIFFALTKRFSQLKKLTKKDLIMLLSIAVVGGSLPFFLFFSGLALTEPAVANIIHKTLFIWVSILAMVFLGEKFNLGYFVGYLLIVLGTFYFAPSQVTLGRGELLILSATLFWAVENIMAKKVLSRLSSEIVGLARMAVGSLILLATVFAQGKLGLFLTLGLKELLIITSGAAILFFYVYTWYKALKYAPASLVTMILSFSVVVGAVLNRAFVGLEIIAVSFKSFLFISLGVLVLFVSTVILPTLKLFKQKS